MIIDLINNAALLITLSVFYGFFLRLRQTQPILSKAFVGFWFACVAITGMIIPFEYQNGAIFDGSSIVLALTGLFGGGISSLIAILVTSSYRLYLGGPGVWAGITTILVSSAVGLYFRKITKEKPEKLNFLSLWGMGILVHIFMLASQLLFPWPMGISIIKVIWLPVLTIFPLAFVFMGILLSNDEKRYKALNQFRELFENHTAVHLLIVPETGKIANANKAASEFYGYTIEVLKKMNISQINNLSKDEVHKQINNALERKSVHFEFRHTLANGNIKDVEVFSNVVEIGGRNFLHSIVHDITEKKYLFDEIVRAKERAEESDRLKSAFLANMSHEIRTPLNAILGFTNLLTDDDDLSKDTRQKFSSIIHQSSDNLLNIINDILDISRLETGQLTLSKKTFSFNNTLQLLHTLYLKKLEEKEKLNISLQVMVPPFQVILYNDENRLNQILINLLDNAIKFTHSGEITFGMRVISKEKIQIYVADTGIGIPKEKHSKIFNRFEQAELDTSTKYGGTGLGLSIVKKLVKMMDGEIYLESETGVGTTFFIEIPFDDKLTNVLEDTRVEEDDALKINNLRLLIVEDDESSLSYYREILRDMNLRIYEAATGKEALLMHNQYKPQVILLDIRLPDINGYLVAKEIRKTDQKVRIIAQTAFAMSTDEVQAIESGCNDYISKPISRTALLDKLYNSHPSSKQ
ncbi:MAG TPA: ATP-binding protein, partial [Bacteroidales bacterium]|nr:ATP-binding protein [Bacteroidales bacterium]